MNTISLLHTLPEVFSGRDTVNSDIWHQEVEIKKGNIYLIEAASGTGKSSLCSYIYGYRNDYQGIISFDGENIKKYSVENWIEVRKHTMSMLFQELRLFPELTAWENVVLKNNLTNHKSKDQIENYFSRLAIEDKRDITVSKLSFGQQQRVAFIRALCQPFDFIFLDEPVSHLDDENNRLVSELLIEELSLQGAGAVITSIGKNMLVNYDKILKL